MDKCPLTFLIWDNNGGKEINLRLYLLHKNLYWLEEQHVSNASNMVCKLLYAELYF